MATLPDFSALPKIPGMGFGEELLRTDYRKKQMLSTMGMADTRPKPAVQSFDTLRLANTQLSDATSKMSLDRKVLRFQGYFKEGVHESPLEQERVRKVVVYYFLEDDTISVSEPKQDNSGIAGQGCLIKRHQIPRPDGTAYSFEDFNVGQQMSFYGKTFYLLDCDTFTRKFLTGLGMDVPEPESFPDDQYTQVRKQVMAAMGPRKQKTGDDMDYHQGSAGRRTKLTPEEIMYTKQFLAHDKEVLRFYCRWDDRDSLYGDIRLFTLHYFLSDDTIEITESNPPNCGRDPFPSFVKRSRVTKQRDGSFINPNASLSFKPEAVEYFTDKDLRIGDTLQIFGRDFLIYNCDEFTKKHLAEKFGVTDFTPIDVAQPGPLKVPVEPPPYNGFGDEDDSLGSWKYLIVKPPKRDIKKFMENSDKQLKFQLRLLGSDPSNEIRRFVVTYYLSDDSISIFEPAQRNSGIVGGKFLQRQRVKRAGPDGLPTGEWLQPQDLFVGATVVINTHTFLVCSTDERSLLLMESNPQQFPKSNIDVVLANLRQLLASRRVNLQQAFADADQTNEGHLSYEDFAAVMERLHLPISEHEILTIMRSFDRGCNGRVCWPEFVQALPGDAAPAHYDAVRDQEWEQIRRIAERQEEDELDRFKSGLGSTVSQLNSFADQTLRLFLDKYNQRRVLFNDTFRTVSEHSADGSIGEPEFRKAVQTRLKLAFTEQQLKALAYRLFPEHLRRIPFVEFQRILNGTSTHFLVNVSRK